jgi:hypothetical protein
MFAVLFFALSSSVCLQIFIKSYTISQAANHLSYAQNIAQGIFAIFESDNSQENLEHCYPNIEENDGNYVIYFDKDWNESAKEDFSYIAKIDCEETNHSYKIEVEISSTKEEIYRQENSYHIPYQLSKEGKME